MTLFLKEVTIHNEGIFEPNKSLVQRGESSSILLFKEIPFR